MSERGSIKARAALIILGAVAGPAVDHYALDNTIRDYSARIIRNIELGPRLDPNDPNLLTLPRKENLPKPEVVEAVVRNSFALQRRVRPEFRDLQVPDANCHGFVIKDIQFKPVAITAAHCIPSEVESSNGKRQPTFLPNGESIFALTVVNSANASRGVTGWEVAPNNLDLARIEASNLGAEGLPLNLKMPPKWSLNYRVSVNPGGQVEITPVHFKGVDKNFYLFADLGNPETTCRPGVSGSVVVNPYGEVLGVVVAGGNTVVTEEMANRFRLNPIQIGREISQCVAVPSKYTRELVQ